MSKNVAEYFACDVFNDEVMKARLPKPVYKAMTKTRKMGTPLDPTYADVVANAIKDWAIEHGATHYTHWFQPMTGSTAEKHDSFISPTDNGMVIMNFSGKELVKGEPDASSFPSGGLRETCSARGYTAWDPTSYCFVKEGSLYIPTVFVSYTGEALDKKTPLLRSMDALSQQAVRILRLFGNTTATKVTSTVGPEQEYFLIDKKMYDKREDLIMTGRTLFGAMPPKGQELDDQYFANLKPRVAAYMADLDEALWKVGVFATTKHNEVAPAQHEMAPVFSTTNISTDQNELAMEVMEKVALKHGLVCLLHEKPFAGVNGSGKHDNWSITTDTGMNLLDPGETPNENIQFLLVLACVIKAVDTHADQMPELVRRKGEMKVDGGVLPGNGAILCIIAKLCVFLGTQLEDVVRQLVETGEARSCLEGSTLHTGVSTVPDLPMDATDRNRTSPFAFTGNKFEFRMVGSSDSIGSPTTTINAIVAEAFCEAADRLEAADMAVHDLIKEYMTAHQRILFNGDGYSKEWEKEAQRRGLPVFPGMIDSVEALTTDKAIRLYERFGIYNRAELESRKEIVYETYVKTIHIEAKTMIDMASKDILPAVMRYTKTLADTIASLESVGADSSVSKTLLKDTSALLAQAFAALEDLKQKEADGNVQKKDARKQAFFYRDEIVPAMEALRAPVDALEMKVDRSFWPMPGYADLLFEV